MSHAFGISGVMALEPEVSPPPPEPVAVVAASGRVRPPRKPNPGAVVESGLHRSHQQWGARRDYLAGTVQRPGSASPRQHQRAEIYAVNAAGQRAAEARARGASDAGGRVRARPKTAPGRPPARILQTGRSAAARRSQVAGHGGDSWPAALAAGPTIRGWEKMSPDQKRAAIAARDAANKPDPSAMTPAQMGETFGRWDTLGTGRLSLAVRASVLHPMHWPTSYEYVGRPRRCQC
jgi:hypothetical protein